MADYGITPNGPNIKRLDEIISDMHTRLSERWGVNTQQTQESLLNWLLVTVADRIAELWEFGEQVYYSQYPATAEGVSLDNVGQFGGSTRASAAKSYYPIHCKGIDGTTLSAGTLISSNTNPSINLSLAEDRKITRSNMNSAQIRLASFSEGTVYSVSLNGTAYTVEGAETADEVLSQLASKINDSSEFSASVKDLVSESGTIKLLEVAARDISTTNTMILTPDTALTTETVTSIITFGTVDTGDIYIANGSIVNIVKADSGLQSVMNQCGYIAGRDTETDAEFRQSYTDKIFNRSSMMLASIRSAILSNVQGVTSVATYENDTDNTVNGRPPHSIEIVVDGGDSTEIAKQIFNKKAAGIGTYGSVSVAVNGQNNDVVTINFNRPVKIYVWMQVTVVPKAGETLTQDDLTAVQEVLVNEVLELGTGTDVIPQKYIVSILENVPKISYVDFSLFSTQDANVVPDSEDYTLRTVTIGAGQRAEMGSGRIGVTASA